MCTLDVIPMAEAKILTDAAVRKYSAGRTRRRIRDVLAKSLFLVIEPSGHKSFQMRFRRPDGRPGKLTLGSFDATGREQKEDPEIGQPLTLAAARSLATATHRRRALGEDVIADHKARKHRQRTKAEERMATSFGACAREFFAEHRVKKWQTRPRRWRDTARVLGLYYPRGSDPATTEPQVIKSGLADIWGDRPVAEIDHHAIHEIVGEAGKRAIPGLERRNRGVSNARKRAMHSALSTLFAWLKRERKIASNPCTDVERPAPPADRDRVLDNAEIVKFWSACDMVGEPFGQLLKLLLLTGCRLNEVAGIRRAELSEDGLTWTIPGERTKNHRTHVMPLAPLAREILATLKPITGEEGLVFTTNGRTPLSGWSKVKRRLDVAMKIPAWRFHDLRRSCVTGLIALGISPLVVELVVNHASGTRGGVAGTYNRAELLPERRAALDRWATHVAGLVAPQPSKVVSL
jgi:integrase